MQFRVLPRKRPDWIRASRIATALKYRPNLACFDPTRNGRIASSRHYQREISARCRSAIARRMVKINRSAQCSKQVPLDGFKQRTTVLDLRPHVIDNGITIAAVR